MEFEKDPIGTAIYNYQVNGITDAIKVESDLCDEDVLPIEYLFRTYDMMPELEQIALDSAKGKVLDVGAAAGCHTKELLSRGLDVKAIDLSAGSVAYLKTQDIQAELINFNDIKDKYDTILILMNGIGIAGDLNNLPKFLSHIKAILEPDGIAYCDSTDIRYLYAEEDGSMWVDLNARYHGEMKFKMTYNNIATDWFKWLYIDFELLQQQAKEVGLLAEIVFDGSNNSYLASLKHIV